MGRILTRRLCGAILLMPTLAIVGALWGDEAKGKLVDVLASEADMNIRYSGGNNAGHTVQVGDSTYKFHLIPSGILHPSCTAVLASGMVICPKSLIEEHERIKQTGLPLGKLLISGNAHVVMSYHKTFDEIHEGMLGEKAIGTTKRGIGPAYEDKAARTGIRFSELIHPQRLREKLQVIVPIKNKIISACGGEILNEEEIWNEYSEYGKHLKSFVADTEYEINEASKANKKILLEGAQGALLDVGLGTYPFVTSSYTTSGGASVGTGLPPRSIQNVVGVFAAYATRVGAGPFPTELKDETGDKIRIAGKEFGTTTGRPRRVGWIDTVALRYSAMVNGFTSVALTRLDVLRGFSQIGICTAYQIDGTTTSRFPVDAHLLENVKPCFEMVQGFEEDIQNCGSIDELPQNAQLYVKRIEEILGVPISIISLGPERQQTIILRKDLLF